MLSPAGTTYDPAAQMVRARFVRAGLVLIFSYVFLANAWMGDDAFITFRAAWNLVHGYGFTYNTTERVLAFTNPLWGLLVSGAYAVTGEFFFTVTALSWVLDLAAGAVLVRRARSWPLVFLTAGWLLSSKALVDYSSSGLEYPLSYFLLVIFATRYLGRDDTAPSLSELRTFTFIAALAFLNRPDAILLYFFPLIDLSIRAFRAHRVRAAGALAVGVAPAVAWLAFATFYYGFPLPNTYYAKVANGLPAFLQRAQGLAYLFNSVRHDPITLGTVVLACLVAWPRGGRARWGLASVCLSVLYTVNIGGDFMSGRFFTLPFLLAVAIVVPLLSDALVRPLAAALVVYNVLVPVAPIKTLPGHQAEWSWRAQNGIKDEMGITYPDSNVLGFAPFHRLPDTVFARDGLSFRGSDRRSTVYCCIGMFGLNAGPSKHVIDSNALADPLLARLPVSPRVYFDYWASHYFRDLPAGYAESVERDRNLVEDPLLHAFYDRLRNVTRGSVWRWSRLADIWQLNVGRWRDVGRLFERRRPVDVSIPAAHERFTTNVGERDQRAWTLAAPAGRDGYLELGPGVPMKAGTYRVRWTGTTEAPPGTPIGHVEAWSGDRLLARQPVVAQPSSDGTLAQIDFRLERSSKHLDYQFFTSGAAEITLERIEIRSAAILEPES